MDLKDLKEQLAAIEHERWAAWQKYLHERLQYSEQKGDDGNTYAFYLMSSGDYEHWSRQIDSDYSELTEEEKQSDRNEVNRYFPLIISKLKDQLKETRKNVGLLRQWLNERNSNDLITDEQIIEFLELNNLK